MNVFAGTDSRTPRCPSVASAGRWLLDLVATIQEIADLAGHSDADEGTDLASRPQTSSRTHATAPADGWPGWR